MLWEPTQLSPSADFPTFPLFTRPLPPPLPRLPQLTCSSVLPSGCVATATYTLRVWRCTTLTDDRASPACPHRVAALWACHRATAWSSASPFASLQQSSSRATGTCWGTTSKRRSSTPSSLKLVGVGWEWAVGMSDVFLNECAVVFYVNKSKLELDFINGGIKTLGKHQQRVV